MSYNVTYTIASFTPARYGQGTIPVVSPNDVDPQVRQTDGGGTVTKVGNTGLSIKQSNDPASKPTVLFIAIKDSAGNYYTPCGLALKSTQNNKPAANFSTQLIAAVPTPFSPPMITLSDANATIDSWNFVVLFQDASGNFGILDPMITNSDTMPAAAAQRAASVPRAVAAAAGA